MELTALPEKRSVSLIIAGAASFVLHAGLLWGFLCVIPTPLSNGNSQLTLSLLSMPGMSENSEQAGRDGDVDKVVSLQKEIQSDETVRSVLSPRFSEERVIRKADAAKREKKKAERVPLKKTAVVSSKDKASPTEGVVASGEKGVVSTGQPSSVLFGTGIDVPFGRPCGPAFTRFSRPVYPLQARRAGISGLVKLRVSLDEAGDVRGIEVLETGHSLLTDAACVAIRRSSFRPYTQDGKSLPSRTVIPIRFFLEQAL